MHRILGNRTSYLYTILSIMDLNFNKNFNLLMYLIVVNSQGNVET